MTTQTFIKIAATQSVDVATNGTITLSYPATYSSSNVVTASGAKMWCSGLAVMFTQGASNFSIAYGGTIVITYLGATTIPAGTPIDFFLPVVGTGTPITDSTGGTASGSYTLAAITAPAANATTSLTADMTAVKNALATLAAQYNALLTNLKNLQSINFS